MKFKQLQLILWLNAGLLLQSCSIPVIQTKEAHVALPAEYPQTAQAVSSTRTVNMDWYTFFDDPQLVQLIDVAIANNKEVNIMAQRIAMAKNEVLARSGEYKPFVNAGAAADIDKVGEFTRNGAVEENLEIKDGKAFPEYLQNYQFGLHASWELDVWKKLRKATKVAQLEYLSSVEGRRFLVTNLVAEVANSYYELQALETQLDNLQQNIKIQQNGLAVVKTLQQYARATSMAVKRFEAEVKKNQSKQYAIKQKVAVLENKLNFLLGRTPQTIKRDATAFMATETQAIDVGVPSQLLENRSDIRSAELALAAAKLNIDVAKANFYPSFAIRGGLGFEAFNPKYLLNIPGSLALSLGGDVIAPLVNRNAIIATYQNASAEQVQAAYEYEQAILQAYMEVSNQLASSDNLDKNYQLKQQQVAKLTDSIEVANQLFKSAHADYLEVLDTQREAVEARSELIETKQKQIAAKIDLYRALGGGWQSEQTAIAQNKRSH